MIYIFNCCKAILSLPAQLCGCAATACDECLEGFGECCKPVAVFFAGCCSGLSKTFQRPLGCYVFMTVCLMTVSLIGVLDALAMEGPYLDEIIEVNGKNETACEEASDVKAMLVGDGVMAIVHILFALYLQRVVWTGLEEAAVKEEAKLAKMRTANNRSKRPMPMADLILSASGKIFLHNIAFCIYFFVLPAYFYMNYVFIQMVAPEGKEGCDPEGWSTKVATLGMLFPVAALIWSFNWVCFLYCHGILERVCPCGQLCFGKRPKTDGLVSRTEAYTSGSSDDEWSHEY